MSDNVIEAEGLTKRYDGVAVVKGISFNIARGEIFGLLGPNGAGKTTTILMLLGLSDISGGTARVLGYDPVREPRQPLHLGRDVLGVAALPTVGEDHDDGAARHPAAAVAIVERLQRVTDPGAARPVGRGRGGACLRPWRTRGGGAHPKRLRRPSRQQRRRPAPAAQAHPGASEGSDRRRPASAGVT